VGIGGGTGGSCIVRVHRGEVSRRKKERREGLPIGATHLWPVCPVAPIFRASTVCGRVEERDGDVTVIGAGDDRGYVELWSLGERVHVRTCTGSERGDTFQ